MATQNAHDGLRPIDPAATSLAVFDLDGTLTDPVPGLLSCHRYALEDVGLDFDELVAAHSTEAGDLVRSPAVEVYGAIGVPDSAAAEAAEKFRERRPFASLEDGLYPGIDVLLTSLASAGWQIALATNQLEAMATRVLGRLEIADRFIAVAGSDQKRTRTTKIQIIEYLLTTLDSPPEGIVVVGDRGTDVEAAKMLRATSIGAAWGFGSIEELIAANADAIAVQPADVTELLLG